MTWKTEIKVNGVIIETIKKLPEKFAFLENDPRVSTYEEPWHTLLIYKNGNRFRVELDKFNLTIDEEIVTPFENKGTVGLTATSDRVSFDAIQYTMGWDEYDSNITGWEKTAGTWNVAATGLMQTSNVGKAAKVIRHGITSFRSI